MTKNGTTSRLYSLGRNGKPTNVRLGDKQVKAPSRKVPLASIRIKQLKRIFADRYGAVLPDDDAGREDLLILLNHIAHRQNRDPVAQMNIEIDQLAPWLDDDDRAAFIGKVMHNPIRYNATTLAEKLRLADVDRQRLRVTSIRPFDVSAEELQKRRQAKDCEYQRKKRRAAGCETRAEYENHPEPWIAEGISRPTWYRRQKAAGQEASIVPELAKTHYAADGLVSTGSHTVQTGLIMRSS